MLADPIKSLSRLISIGKEILAESDVNTVLSISMDHLIKLSGAERGIIILDNKSGEQYFQTARNMDRENINSPEFEISNTIINKVKKSSEAVFLENALQEKTLNKSNSVMRLKILSVICLPLKYNNEQFGVLYLDNRTILGRFNEEVCELIKSFADYISLAAYRSLERFNWEQKNFVLEEELRTRFDFDSIIGKSRKMIEVMQLISKVAETDATVLIEGESGTGKELAARAIHFNSRRSNKPILTVNCAAFPENLLESEFFGHEKGAFTGAVKQYKGKFEMADGGTLFLDELDEMSLALQAKLLRVIQFGEYTPLGNQKSKKCDVRIVAASKSGLKNLVKEGNFREDLFYRLNLFTIRIPALRDRQEDKLLLAEYFLIKTCKKLKKDIPKISVEAKRIINNYSYPGNVRELENIIHRAVILAKDNQIVADDFPEDIIDNIGENHKEIIPDSLSFKEAKDRVIEEFERNYIMNKLEECDGVVSRAAESIGMHKKNFHEKMNKYGIRAKKHFEHKTESK